MLTQSLTSDIHVMDRVLADYHAVDFSSCTDEDVLEALSAQTTSIRDFAALLSPCAGKYLEQMAAKAKALTEQYFGVNKCLYTPLYIANYCVNHCSYCGFNCTNKIHRAKLTMEEIEQEAQAISSTGLREILLLTGESRFHSDVEYIGEAVKIMRRYFNTIGLEVYPMDVSEYEYLHSLGADYVSVYQETYDRDVYDKVHISGPKKVYDYRFNALERAIQGGMRGGGLGALLGLSDFRRDAFGSGLHAYWLQKKYPAAELSFSVPRLRPYVNNDDNQSGVGDRDFLQVILAYRIFMPFMGFSLSSRENAAFRDNCAALAPTKISAGVKTGVGGHSEEEKGDVQFKTSDERSVDEIYNALLKRGLQPVFNDYVYIIDAV